MSLDGSPAMHTEAISFVVDSNARPGWLVVPVGTEPLPAVVVVHELYGLNANIRQIAERFAAHGYAALAVDLFDNRSRVLCMARMLRGAMLDNPFDHIGIADTQHSFCNDQRSTYNAAASDDAWMRTIRFFDQHIRSNAAERGST